MPRVRSTSPPAPKSTHGRPVSASSASSRASSVPVNTRRRHGPVRAGSLLSQTLTPREVASL